MLVLVKDTVELVISIVIEMSCHVIYLTKQSMCNYLVNTLKKITVLLRSINNVNKNKCANIDFVNELLTNKFL